MIVHHFALRRGKAESIDKVKEAELRIVAVQQILAEGKGRMINSQLVKQGGRLIDLAAVTLDLSRLAHCPTRPDNGYFVAIGIGILYRGRITHGAMWGNRNSFSENISESGYRYCDFDNR